MKNKEQLEESRQHFIELQKGKKKSYELSKVCTKCGAQMKYMYGEMYQCPCCGYTELSDFGKVREYLDANGPMPALAISEATGVSVDLINQYLREGRVEIPDGSDVYIQCQCCGTDIRYGRYCPECMLKLSKGVEKALWMPEVGERPTHKSGMTGKMHTLANIRLHSLE